MFRLRRPWVLLFSVWFGAAVIGSFMGCSENAKTDTAPPPPPPKKTTKQTAKEKPVVVEPDTTPKVVEPTPEIIAKFQPGLALKFVDSVGANAKVLDARGIRMAALHVPSGEAQSTMLPAGPFQAMLSGYIKQNLNGECSFKMVGLGNAKLYINGKLATTMTDGAGKDSAVVPLPKGYNQIDVVYAGPSQGDATLRVYWKSDEQNSSFGWEPLQPSLLFARGDDDALTKGQDEREGRFLFATLNCAQCHGLPAKLQEDACKMPELKQRGPSLENAGQRFHQDWVAEWVADPQSMRPDATMPHVLHGDDADKSAAHIAAYLATLKEGTPFPAIKTDDAELAEKGEKLYISLGCIACHHLNEPDANVPDEFGRVALYYVNAKYPPNALADFLRRPHDHNPWLKMPDFRLKPDEVEQLANYLINTAEGTLDPGTRGIAKKGEELFGKSGCAQCHVTKLDQTATAKANVDFPKVFTKGCLAGDDKDRGKAPEYMLTAAQQRGLRAFLATDGNSLTREVPAEFSYRQVKLLQCNACHSRDGVPSRWYSVIEKEGAGLPIEYLPHLTWTGQKLQNVVTENMLEGVYETGARHWLKARMPSFPTRAKLLALGLSYEHGFGRFEDDPNRPAADSVLATTGEELMSNVGGFSCSQCHDRGKEKALQPFGSDGINLADAAKRLRYEFYMQWMMGTTRFDPTTKMVPIPITNGKTALTEVLDGDARRQFEAIWHYMQTLPAMKGN